MPIPFRDSLFGDESTPTLEEQLTIWRVAQGTCLRNTSTTLRAHLRVVVILASSLDIWAMCPEEDGTWQGAPVFFFLHIMLLFLLYCKSWLLSIYLVEYYPGSRERLVSG